MWTSKGRSGYGDSTIGGDYDSWDGISPNGRQYKNEATMETRDLSGADYWHLRKQNRPTEQIPAELHMLKNGKANINAYADKEAVKKPASKVSIKHKILPQAARVERLTQQMRDLVVSYKAGEMDINEYSLLLDILSAKKDRAEVLLKKALAQKPIREDDVKADIHQPKPVSNSPITDSIKQKACQVWTEARMFLVGSVAACTVLLWLAN